jgi:hypothetical protein
MSEVRLENEPNFMVLLKSAQQALGATGVLAPPSATAPS